MKISTKFVTGPINQIFNPELRIYLPPYDEEKEIISSFQEMAIRRKDKKYSFSELQIHLFETMLKEQRFIKTLEENSIKNIPDDVQETILETAKFPFYAMRNIANGMAFRFMDYNLALMQSVGTHSNGVDDLSSDGILHELEYFSAYTDSTSPDDKVFMCSLCDLVGTGDILTKNDDQFELIEVKKGHPRGARITRQKERLKSLEDFFNTRIETIDNHKIQLINLKCRKNYCSQLDECISNCLINDIAHFNVSDYQITYCINLRRDQNAIRKDIDKIYGEIEKLFGMRYLDLISSKYMYKTGLNVPFSVFPITPEHLSDLLLGGVFFISFISLEAIEKHITDKGWKYINRIEHTAKNNSFSSPIYFAVDNNNIKHNFSIPIDYLLDCGINFIDLDCLLENSIHIADNYSGIFTVFYEDEYKIWR